MPADPQDRDDLWVFGYGSLMWRPGFAFIDTVPARLYGAHRALCVYSWVHRGTRERPGLVLGLDHGGSCRGVAFRVHGNDRSDVIDYLRAREQVTMVYREVYRPVRLLDPAHAPVRALCYVVDRDHAQYSGALDPQTQARLIGQGRGRSGGNVDYVRNTLAHLRDLGVDDRNLENVHDLLPE